MSNRLNDLQGLANGVNVLLRSMCKIQRQKTDLYFSSFIQKDLESLKYTLESQFSQSLSRSPLENLDLINRKANAFLSQAQTLFKSGAFSGSNFFTSKRSFHSSVLFKNYHTKNQYQIAYKSFATSVDTVDKTVENKDNIKKKFNVPKFKNKVF